VVVENSSMSATVDPAAGMDVSPSAITSRACIDASMTPLQNSAPASINFKLRRAAQGWWDEESSRFGMTSSVEKSELIEEKRPVG
jgi:hypothetical protein